MRSGSAASACCNSLVQVFRYSHTQSFRCLDLQADAGNAVSVRSNAWFDGRDRLRATVPVSPRLSMRFAGIVVSALTLAAVAISGNNGLYSVAFQSMWNKISSVTSGTSSEP